MRRVTAAGSGRGSPFHSLGVALHATKAAAEMRSAKCEISSARCKGCSGPAHYPARSWLMNLKTARSLRTHLPSRRATSDNRWRRLSVGSGHLMQFAGASSGPPVPLRWRPAHPRSAPASLCALLLLHLPRICSIVQNERQMKTHMRSSPSQLYASASKAQVAPPLPTPNPSFKRTCQGLRPCPSA